MLTLSIHRQVNIFDRSIRTEYFTEVAFIDVLSKFLHYNLQAVSPTDTLTTMIFVRLPLHF